MEGVAPSEETVQDGTYKIQRPFVFVTNDSAELSETAQAFFDFAQSDEADELIRAAGAVPPRLIFNEETRNPVGNAGGSFRGRFMRIKKVD